MAPAQDQVRQCGAVFLAVAGLPKQAEVAVGRLAQILCWRFSCALHGLGHRLLTRGAPPGLDHMPDEVHTSVNWLQDGLRRVEPDAQAGQEVFDLAEPVIQLLWRFMQQHEVIDVADVVLGLERVLAELVQGVEVDVGEELR
ncbi:hypothetical protein D3C80_1367230 [compost metagenome]